MEVNKTRSGLFLQNYLSDRDTPFGSLTVWFGTTDPLVVSYDPVTSEVTIRSSGRASDTWVTFYAEDDNGNIALVRVRIKVVVVPDFTEPDGDLSYFFNPVADRWVHYILIGDSTTSRIHTTFSHYSLEEPLSFVQQDSLPGTMTWIAPYYFTTPGTYSLTAELYDDAIPANVRGFFLPLSVSIPKAAGDVITSPDGHLTLSYPSMPLASEGLIIIAEEMDSMRTRLLPGNSHASLGKSSLIREPTTIYALDSNLPEAVMVTLTWHQPDSRGDTYYSFYELVGDDPRRIDTYTGSAAGEFSAVVVLGRDIIFSASDVPASKAPLPDEELFCYPNPFNSTIQVRFLLRMEDRGRVVIYNLLGQEVFSTPAQPYAPGVHNFNWQGVDTRGQLVSSGPYFIRLQTERGKVLTRKVTLLK
jgi:hypothetical protein